MTTPVPILFTIPNFLTAGSGQAMWNVVSRLDRSRFAPTIAVLKAGGRLDAEIGGSGIRCICSPFTVAARPLATLGIRARRAAKPFRRFGFALWHSFHYLDDYTEPIVARLAGTRSWMFTKKNMSWGSRAWRLRSLLATRIAAQNTDMLRDFFGSALYRRKGVLVPTSVDTERYRPGTPPRLGLRARLGTPPGTPVIGCVAQLVPIKGHPVLIESLLHVPAAHLWLAGKELDQGYAAQLRRQAAELGVADRVSFLGEVQDVPALLSELDAFVLPTPSGEGCPVALLEAMAAGLACVAADVPGSRDVIESGTSGLLVRPGDPAALGTALRNLAGDAGSRRALGAAARGRILQRYTIDREVAAYEAIYSEILGEELRKNAA